VTAVLSTILTRVMWRTRARRSPPLSGGRPGLLLELAEALKETETLSKNKRIDFILLF
jgi:hypothetical protein